MDLDSYYAFRRRNKCSQRAAAYGRLRPFYAVLSMIVVARFAPIAASCAHVRGRGSPLPALRRRIAQLVAEGRHAGREAATWQLAEL